MRRVLLLSLLLAVPALAQDRQATERRLSGLRSQIEGVEQRVRETRGQEATELQALEGLDAEVQLREQLVSGYRTQIGTIRGETETLRRSIERLETEIQDAKQSYRERARHAYMHGRRNSRTDGPSNRPERSAALFADSQRSQKPWRGLPNDQTDRSEYRTKHFAIPVPKTPGLCIGLYNLISH